MLLRNVGEGVGDRPGLDARQQAALGAHHPRRRHRRDHRDGHGLAWSRASGARSSTRSKSPGPTTFYVIRFFSQTPLNPDRLPYEVRIRPVLQRSDAEAIRRAAGGALRRDLGAGLPADRVPGEQHPAGDRVRRGRPLHGDPGRHAPQGPLVQPGGARPGSPSSCWRATWRICLFGRLDPLGKQVGIGGRSFRVIGDVRETRRTSSSRRARRPQGWSRSRARESSFQYDETNALFLAVKPRSRIEVGPAMDAVTVALRRARGPPARETRTPSTSSPRTRSWTWSATSPPTSSWRWWRSPAWRCWWAGSASWRS